MVFSFAGTRPFYAEWVLAGLLWPGGLAKTDGLPRVEGIMARDEGSPPMTRVLKPPTDLLA